MQDRTQVHVKLNREVSRKLDFVLDNSSHTITSLMHNAIIQTYSELTDTVRVPVIGRVVDDRIITNAPGNGRVL